ncbi:glycoside hydrolase [Mariannaea sp. PMI_226]|nr:glycoside hydrolase [Mariannaea sp. PMI_226]
MSLGLPFRPTRVIFRLVISLIIVYSIFTHLSNVGQPARPSNVDLARPYDADFTSSSSVGLSSLSNEEPTITSTEEPTGTPNEEPTITSDGDPIGTPAEDPTSASEVDHTSPSGVDPTKPLDEGLEKPLDEGLEKPLDEDNTSSPNLDFPGRNHGWSSHKLQYSIPRRNMTVLLSGRSPDLAHVQYWHFNPEEPENDRDALKEVKIDIKRTCRKSWNAYKTYAWGQDELNPLTLTGHNDLGGWSASMIDALGTLWLMDMKPEFEEAVMYITENVDWNRTIGESLDVAETSIRHLGGLLSAYDLSGEKSLLFKAIELGDMLYAAFDNEQHIPPSRIPFEHLRAGRGRPELKELASKLSSMTLEFTRLSQLTEDPKYYDAITRINKALASAQDSTLLPGLWPAQIGVSEGFNVDGTTFNWGTDTGSLYESLAKEYLLLGGQEPMYKTMHLEAVDATLKHLVFRPMLPGKPDLLMIGQAEALSSTKTTFHPYLDHASCSAAAMFALGGKLFGHYEHVVYGDKLARACAHAYSLFPEATMPESSLLRACPDLYPCEYVKDNGTRPAGFQVRDGRFSLRPEGIESIFILYRITGNIEYRDLALVMWEQVKQTAKTEMAYAAVKDVREAHLTHVDQMGSFWMSGTLKYFYLTFSDENILDLDGWVFTKGGHPLSTHSVKGLSQVLGLESSGV